MANGATIVNLASTAGHMWRERTRLLWELATIDDWSEAEAWVAAHPVMFEETYSKFKEALIVWTQSVASEWFMRHGVRMNCVSPGPVKTPIFDDFVRAFGTGNVNDIIERTGRIAVPDDIAHPVLFLLDDSSRWIVGVDLPTEGGLLASRFAGNARQGKA
jgi:NAD(P)-dependent dehydrogenase (short-subunit alcohol dehydrogenase family)